MFKFPWEQNIKPDFVNPEGFEWYVENNLTKWAKREASSSKPLKGVVAFLVRHPEKEGSMEYVLINTERQVLYVNTNYEAVAVRIDLLRATQTYDEADAAGEQQKRDLASATGFGKNRKRKYTK